MGILKAYDEETSMVKIGFDDRDMEFPVKDIALIRKSIDF